MTDRQTATNEQTALRYKALIESQMNYLYHKNKMEQFQKEVNQNLTVHEYKHKCFNSDSVGLAFKLLGDEFTIESNQYVKSSLLFKGITVHLHDIEPMKSGALKHILEEGK